MLFSEPKIPQSGVVRYGVGSVGSFSALQRAENSSMNIRTILNAIIRGFSALQRAENSSISCAFWASIFCLLVSVLFSEPKIPQS